MKKSFFVFCLLVVAVPCFGLDNGKLYQCDSISMYVDASGKGESDSRMIEVTFHYSSKEIGGALYWQNDNLDCECELYSQGREITSKRDTLTNWEQHFFMNISSWDRDKLKGNNYLKCVLQPGGKKIEIKKDIWFH